jgi:hypothetical protein
VNLESDEMEETEFVGFVIQRHKGLHDCVFSPNSEFHVLFWQEISVLNSQNILLNTQISGKRKVLLAVGASFD